MRNKYVDHPWGRNGTIPQRCVSCCTENSAEGYFKTREDGAVVRHGVCREHFETRFQSIRPAVVWFGAPLDMNQKPLTLGALVRICTPKRGRTSKKAFMINQVCRDVSSGAQLSNGAFVYADRLILEGE